MIYDSVLHKVGQTPLVQLNPPGLHNINLYAKLEYFNPTGSVKDRAASYMIKRLLELGIINRDTTLIESSSGNFGISLATFCKEYGMKFICVIDPHISPTNEILIQRLSTAVIKVTELDHNGGYLLRRIEKVKELLEKTPNAYWVNQYGNPHNADAYYQTLGEELCNEMDSIEYVFMGVSSGGTITGVSRKIKERYPLSTIVAVDIVGSVIFGGPPKKRYIPGIGAGMVPEILKLARIDEVVYVDESSTISMCHELLDEHSIFAGGSSGSVFSAIHSYFLGKSFDKKPNVVTIFADRGERYVTTIYNDQWYANFGVVGAITQ